MTVWTCVFTPLSVTGTFRLTWWEPPFLWQENTWVGPELHFLSFVSVIQTCPHNPAVRFCAVCCSSEAQVKHFGYPAFRGYAQPLYASPPPPFSRWVWDGGSGPSWCQRCRAVQCVMLSHPVPPSCTGVPFPRLPPMCGWLHGSGVRRQLWCTSRVVKPQPHLLSVPEQPSRLL